MQFSWKNIEQILDLRVWYLLLAWRCSHLDCCYKQFRVQQRTNPKTGWSTWQFNLYNKSDSNSIEIYRQMRLPKLHSVSFAYLSKQCTTYMYHMQLKAQPNLAPTHAWTCTCTWTFPAIVLCVHKQLPVLASCNFKPLHCCTCITAFTQDSVGRPAIMLLK